MSLRPVLVASVVAATCVGVFGQIVAFTPCYKNFLRSCGALHANTARVCVSGTTATPCGDIILIDQSVGDVMAASGNGRDRINTSCGTVTVQIAFFRCDGSACNSLGAFAQRTCTSRCIEGSTCSGQTA